MYVGACSAKSTAAAQKKTVLTPANPRTHYTKTGGDNMVGSVCVRILMMTKCTYVHHHPLPLFLQLPTPYFSFHLHWQS